MAVLYAMLEELLYLSDLCGLQTPPDATLIAGL